MAQTSSLGLLIDIVPIRDALTAIYDVLVETLKSVPVQTRVSVEHGTFATYSEAVTVGPDFTIIHAGFGTLAFGVIFHARRMAFIVDGCLWQYQAKYYTDCDIGDYVWKLHDSSVITKAPTEWMRGINNSMWDLILARALSHIHIWEHHVSNTVSIMTPSDAEIKVFATEFRKLSKHTIPQDDKFELNVLVSNDVIVFIRDMFSAPEGSRSVFERAQKTLHFDHLKTLLEAMRQLGVEFVHN